MKIFNKIIKNILLISFAILLIGLGIQYSKISRKQAIFGKMIQKVGNSLFSYAEISEKYDFKNDFEITSNIKTNLTSEIYEEKSYFEADSYKKNQLINNLSKLDTNITFKQSKEKEKLLLSVLSKTEEEEEFFSGKYYIEDATKYYLVNSILDQYVNDGNDNYFETITKENTTKENIDYIYQTIVKSLQKSIREDEIKDSEEELTINNKKTKVRKLSLKVTDKYFQVLLRRILLDLQNDTRSKRILESIIPEFSNIEIRDEQTFFAKDESFTINLFVNKLIFTPIKYEVVHQKGEESTTYKIIGNGEKGTFYYMKNNEVKFMANYEASPKMIEALVTNQHSETIGYFKLEKSNNSFSLNMSLNIDKENFDFTYSTIFKNYSKDLSYVREDKATIKWLQNDKVRISGKLEIESNITKDFKVDENVDKSVLYSTLEEKTKEKFKLLKITLKEKLEG